MSHLLYDNRAHQREYFKRRLIYDITPVCQYPEQAKNNQKHTRHKLSPQHLDRHFQLIQTGQKSSPRRLVHL